MEIRQLQALVAVADTGSVTRAAELLHLVQPAVTRHIQTLETALGVQLFERSRSGMRLTVVGRQIVEHARRALAEIERAREEARSAGEAVHGIVTVAILPSVANLLSPQLVSIVSQRFPGIRLRVVTGYAGTLAQWLESGQADIALLFDQPVSAAFSVTELLDEDIWAIAPEGRLSAPVELAQVLSEPLVMPSAPHGLRTLVEAASARIGASLRVRVETNDAALQKRLVAAGHGWSVLPAIAAADEDGAAVSAAPIVDPVITRTIGLAIQRYPAPPRAVSSVADVLNEVVSGAVASGSWRGVRAR